MDALQAAFDAADISYRLSLKAAYRDPGSMLAPAPGSYGTLGPQPGSQMNAMQQYAHLRGWVFAAVRAIAQRIASQDIFVGKLKGTPKRHKSIGDAADPLDSHPLLDLLNDPNHLLTRWALLFSMVADLLCTGRCFLWVPTERKTGKQLWPVPTSWCRPIDAFQNKWQIMPRGGQATFDPDPDEFVPLSLPDPSNPVAGALSPLQAEAEAVQADEAIQTAQYRAFANGLFPQVLIRAGRLPSMTGVGEGPRPALTPEQKRELTDAIRQVCGGAYQYGSPLILDSLIESVDKLSLTPVEMDFLNSGMMTKARILQGFGVSPFSIGQVENGNRAAMMVAEKTFCANVLNPLGEMLSLSLTKHLLPMFSDPGERLVLWIEKFVAQDDEMDLKKWELGLRFGAVDRNEYRRVSMNLPEDPKFDGAPDPMSQMFRNSVNRPTDLGEVGTRTPDLIDTWQFDAAHNRVAARNGNGKV